MDIEKPGNEIEKTDKNTLIENKEINASDKNNNQVGIKVPENPRQIPNNQEIQLEQKTLPETKYKKNIQKCDDEEKNKNHIILISDNKGSNVNTESKLQNVKNIEFGIVRKININGNSNSKKKSPHKIPKNSKKKIEKNENTIENEKMHSTIGNKNIKVDSINNEKEEKKPKNKIFNNKKNNKICSNLLKSVMNNEKELISIPYAKEKQKKNKTMNTIGNANGISYSNISIFHGWNNLNSDNNILNIIRDNDKVNKKGKKIRKSLGLLKKHNPTVASINLNSNKNYNADDKYLKEMLGRPENIQ